MVLHIFTLKQLILTCKAITPTSAKMPLKGQDQVLALNISVLSQWFWLSTWLIGITWRSLAFYHAFTALSDFSEGQGDGIHSHHLATTVRQILRGYFAWAGSKVNSSSEYQETDREVGKLLDPHVRGKRKWRWYAVTEISLFRRHNNLLWPQKLSPASRCSSIGLENVRIPAQQTLCREKENSLWWTFKGHWIQGESSNLCKWEE